MNWASQRVSTYLLAYSLLTTFLFVPTLDAGAQTGGTERKNSRAFKFSPSDSALISEGYKKYTDSRIRSMWVQIKMIF